jgi:holo-[acyl-carrier protein] synthase
MIVGMGLDLCEIDRIAAMVERWGARFTHRVFTPGEREYALGKANEAHHLAARFAVKEATLKALGVPAGLRWQEMEVRGGGKEAPRLELHGKARAAAERLGARRFHLSISHAGEMAAAVVIAEGEPSS